MTQAKPFHHLCMIFFWLYCHLHTLMSRYLFLRAFAKIVYQLMLKHMYAILMNC
jgi:hypothetical protein